MSNLPSEPEFEQAYKGELSTYGYPTIALLGET
jgi:hypothetical protein